MACGSSPASDYCVYLFGAFRVEHNLQVVSLPTEKTRSLFAYLILHPGGHSREKLTTIFWGDSSSEKAQGSLRKALTFLRKTISSEIIIADRENIQLNPLFSLWVDVFEFERQANELLAVPSPDFCLFDLDLYQGDLLSDFYDEWILPLREHFHTLYIDLLLRAVEGLRAQSEYKTAIEYAQKILANDVANERAHQHLMFCYITLGDRNKALQQYEACQRALRDELAVEPTRETQDLYHWISQSTSDLPSLAARLTNLPIPISSFVGRSRELATIKHLLSNARLVTLTGAGGSGKTRLAIHAATDLIDSFKDGVWWVELAPLNDPLLVPSAVAKALGVSTQTDQPLTDVLARFLDNKRTLLVLDNCEHLIDACAQLTEHLLNTCPDLKILCTSRETLDSTGENVWQVPTLSLPDVKSVSLAELLLQYEGIRLFVERASAVKPDFTITETNALAIVQVCQQLDGIPLAIELAAARVNILSVEEVLKQLHDSFALLAGHGRGILPHHKTLRASMDWSWRLLTEAEQRFMRQLTVFAGGWTLESAQAVCDGNVLDLIGALVKKSLIAVNQKAGHKTRYHFHEIVHQYAREKLVEACEEQSTRTLHLKYFLGLSQQAELSLTGSTQLEWLARLNDECNNIRTGLEWAGKTDVEAGLYLSSRLYRFWESIDLHEGSIWLSGFLQRPESLNCPKARAKALCVYVWILVEQQQFEAARSAAKECLEIYRTLGDQQGEIDGLLGLAFVSSAVTEKLALGQRALEIAHALGDEYRQEDALWRLGWFDQDNRFIYWEQAITLARSSGDLLGLAAHLGMLGHELVMNGDFDSAQKYLDEAAVLHDDLHKVKSYTERFHYAQGQIALVRNDFETARAYFQENAQIGIEIGSRQKYLWSQVRLGYVALCEGSLSEARQLFGDCAHEFQRDKYTIGVIFALEGMAGLLVEADKHIYAARLVGWADTARKDVNNMRSRLEQADIDKIIAACLAKMGKAAFSDAYDEGGKMLLDEAMAFAFSDN